MFEKVRNTRIREIIYSIIAFLLATIYSTEINARQLVVIDSTNSTFTMGQVLDSTKPIDLGQNTKLTLITDSGQVIRLIGPFSKVPYIKNDASSSSSGTRLIQLLLRLVGPENRDQSSVGGLRSRIKVAELPMSYTWAIDFKRSGDHCVLSTETRFWRTKSRKSEEFSLRPLPNGLKITANWPEKTELLKWPVTVPIIDGSKYKIKVSGIPTRIIILHVAPSQFITPVHGIAWMVEQGCINQARSLLGLLKLI